MCTPFTDLQQTIITGVLLQVWGLEKTYAKLARLANGAVVAKLSAVSGSV